MRIARRQPHDDGHENRATTAPNAACTCGKTAPSTADFLVLRSLSWRVSLEGVRTQEPHLLLVEACLHPAQHDVVDALLVA